MKKAALITYSLLLIPSLLAAPPKNAGDPVAEGYPAWTGITPKNYISGRVLLSDAELRQRVATIVVEFDAAKAAEQLEQTGDIARFNGIQNMVGFGSVNWAAVEIPRDVMVIYVAHNAKDHKAVVEAMKIKDAAKEPGLVTMSACKVPVYEGVTFEGAPANGGKFPFVYVMGVEGTEPLFKGACEKKTRTEISKLISIQRQKVADDGTRWRPYYGYVAEPKHFKDIEKSLAKGKPLDAVEAKLKKGIVSKTPEVAKEAQMLYDALQQTKSDQVYLIRLSVTESPHVSAYTLGKVLKCWPKLKKQLKESEEKIKSNAAAQPLIKLYPKVAQWADPEFLCKNAAEAKKIVAELTKMKKQLEPMKEDANNIAVQNGALLLDGVLDELITTIPARVATK